MRSLSKAGQGSLRTHLIVAVSMGRPVVYLMIDAFKRSDAVLAC